MSKPRVFTASLIEFKGTSPARDLLEGAGCEVIYRPSRPGWPDADTRVYLEGVYGIIAGGENFNAHTLEKADALRIIARNGVGYDKVDLALCTRRGIVVTYTLGAMADAVADQAMGLLLALVRQIATGDRVVKAGGYDVEMGEDLAAMTLGLLGCGRIGCEVVRRALAFKMRVLVYDPWVEPAAIEKIGAIPVSREQLLAEADAISLHTPLTPENAHMINADFLSRMKKGSYLINTARGGLVDEKALIGALKSEYLAGAGLDTQASEPPTGTSLELVRLDRVVALPHAASKTFAARRRMMLMAAQSIVDWMEGRVPQHVVNREVLERLR